MASDLVDRYFQAVNGEDWSFLGSLWHENASLAATGASPRHGRDQIIAYYRKVLANYVEHQDTPGRVLRCGTSAVVEIGFCGRVSTGASVRFDAVDVFDLADDCILRLTTWYDTAAVARQLSVGAG